MRIDGRHAAELRRIDFIPNYTIYAEGSILISMGNTKVLCTATIEDNVPRWMLMQEKKGGWVTGEYALLPRSTQMRTQREIARPTGRTQEIRRLIGRCLRAAVDLEKLGHRTCIIDCDVLQADGGTRTAAVTGGYVALALALNRLITTGEIDASVIISPVAAVSVGIVNDAPLLDLCYQEDHKADVDANIIMNAKGEYIEIQISAEGKPFSRVMLEGMMSLAHQGIVQLLAAQQSILNNPDCIE